MQRTAFLLILAFVLLIAPGFCLAAGLTGDQVEAIVRYEPGTSRATLAEVDATIRAAWPDQYPAIEEDLLRTLKSPGITRAGRDYVCRKLARIGSARSVPALAAMLREPAFSDMARYALEQIDGAEASAALREALSVPDQATRVGVIASLGERGDADAVLPLAGLLEEGSTEVRAAALAALGRIADKRAARALKESGAPEGLEAEWCDASLACAYGLLEAGDTAGAERMFQDIQGSARRGMAATAALIGLVRTRPGEAVPMLVDALRAEDAGLRKTAAKLLVEVPGEEVTLALADMIDGLRPDTQVALLSTLSDRGDRAAAPAVESLAESGDRDVRAEALTALGGIGTVDSVPLLARAAAGRGAAADAATASLVRLSAAGVEERMIVLVSSVDARTQAALIRALTERHCTEAVPTLLTLAAEADVRVRAEACKALAELAGPADLPAVLSILEDAPDRRLRDAAGNAAVAVCRRHDDREEAAAVVLPVLRRNDGEAEAAVLAVLGRVGGQAARDAVVEAAQGGARDAAVRALCEWPDAGAAGDLLDLARDAESAVHRVLALRAFVRVVGLPSSRPAPETVRMLAEAMKAAERPAERKTVLSSMAEVPDPAALEFAERYVDDRVLAAEAQSAVVRVALALSGARPAEARQALELVRDDPANTWLAGEAADALKAMAGCEDFITAWLVSGPYVHEGTGGSGLFAVEFAPESGFRDAAWQLCPAATDPDRPWMVDLLRVFGGSDRSAYLRTRVFSPSDQDALLSVGSDDGIKAWLNGEVVLSVDKSRPLKRDEDQAEVVLKEGRNDLLLKVTQGGGDWAVCARFLTPDGETLEGLRAAVE